MNHTVVSAQIVDANVEFFRSFAHKYDRYESHLFDPFLQQMLISDLDRITANFKNTGTRPTALDCGGGTGNISLKLLERGWSVSVVDVSPDMLAILRQKCEAQKLLAPSIANQTVETYLGETSESYDFICFGAVLHHLHSYLEVVRLAGKRIRPGGFFYSNFDRAIPNRPFLADVVNSIDTFAAKMRYDMSDLMPGALRRLRKLRIKHSSVYQRRVASFGDLADYYSEAGVDDSGILDALKREGFVILEHLRYGTGRTAPIRILNDFCHFSESLKIVARR